MKARVMLIIHLFRQLFQSPFHYIYMRLQLLHFWYPLLTQAKVVYKFSSCTSCSMKLNLTSCSWLMFLQEELATTGEKEWYFYCPRDRKYRNSARPNRVTGAGFWKATGTDRPIYSSEGTKCIGLKKSLVFYKGRAAKGIKTDWMMHEFRLPSLTNSAPPKRLMDKSVPANVKYLNRVVFFFPHKSTFIFWFFY